MTEEAKAENASTENASTENSNDKSEDILSKVSTLEETVKKQEELINKLRTHEKSSLSEAEEAKKTAEAEREKRKGVEGELDSLKDVVEQKFTQLAVNAALETALVKENVHNVDSAMKLISKDGIDITDTGKANAEAIAQRINTLRETDGYLFKSEESEKSQPKPTNSTRRAGEQQSTNSSFGDQLQKITSTRDLQKFLNQQK